MTYAQRNNLTISGVIVLLLITGVLTYRAQKQALAKIKKQNKELSMRLKDELDVTNTIGQFTNVRDSLFYHFKEYPKKLVNAKEPAFSLRFINWLIRRNHLNIDFDFYLNSKKKKKQMSIFSYTLKGESNYRDFCALVWYIARYPVLYKIKSVSLKRSQKDENSISFSMVLEGYSVPNGWDPGEDLNRVMTVSTLDWYREFRYDAFMRKLPRPVVVRPRPVVVKRTLPPEPPGLVDVEKARLIAITSNQIYLKDRTGKLVSLKMWDRVHRGNLIRIDAQNNRAVFRITTLAGSKLVTLNLEYK